MLHHLGARSELLYKRSRVRRGLSYIGDVRVDLIRHGWHVCFRKRELNQQARDTEHRLTVADEVNDSVEHSGQLPRLVEQVEVHSGRPNVVSSDSQWNTGPDLDALEMSHLIPLDDASAFWRGKRTGLSTFAMCCQI